MRHRTFARLILPYIALVVLGAIILAVYAPGLRGPFVFDDIPNIVNNKSIAKPVPSAAGLTDAAWSGNSGPLKRPIAFISFYVDALIAGGVLNTLPFKLTNILIHLLNVVLVYVFARQLMRHALKQEKDGPHSNHQTIAVAAAAMWGLHPIHATTVLYVVQRMTSLATLFVLLGTIIFLVGRNLLNTRPQRAWVLMWSGIGIALVLGLSAKENAALMPALVLAIEFTLLDQRQCDANARRRLRQFYLAVCAVPLLLAAAWFLTNPDIIFASYASRDFSPTERLLTEARALWFYLSLLAIPDLTTLTLFHDDFPLSTGLADPWTTLPAVAGVILIITVAIILRRKVPLLSLAILWFFIAHGVESTIIGLELVHEHRNYLPDIGLFVVAPYGLWHGAQTIRRHMLVGTACLALLIAYAGVTFLRAANWSSEEQLIESMVNNHPKSARSQAIMAELLAYRRDSLTDAIGHYRTAMELAPTNTAIPIRLITVVTERSASTTQKSTKPSAVAIPDLSQLSGRISQQLATRVPSVDTLAALDTNVNCIVNPPHRCRELYPYVLRWFQVLLHNPDLTSDLRFLAADLTLRLTIWRGEYRSALDTVTYAKLLDPGNDQYSLMEADVFRLLGEIERSEQILETLGTTDHAKNGELRHQIERIRAMIRPTGAAEPQIQAAPGSSSFDKR